jgi:hypothetical protein
MKHRVVKAEPNQRLEALQRLPRAVLASWLVDITVFMNS